ncbi:MAG: patatin-like phospholipase family protein [Gemmatimonadetes bacterium]|nr:patatin-like phospholipase family protein [Gemmatimonadota bacterium]
MPTARRGRHHRRLGLALAGGGPAGAVYEIGALRALEEAVEGLDLTACSVYVGVSAGAFIASSLANGQSTTSLVRGLVRDEPGEPPFDPAAFFLPAYGEWIRRGLQLPGLVADTLWQLSRSPNHRTLVQSFIRLSRALPLGLFDNVPVRRYLERLFSRPGRTDDFRKLRQRLFVVAADLESGTPIVFGSPGWERVPISQAVQASTAVPGLYPPVEVQGRLCVDGVLLKTVHASVALEHGAKLLFCINPLVPVDVAQGEASGALERGALLRRGVPAILSQTFRTLIHSRMVVGMSRYRSHFPGTDVVLLEPERSEYQLFFSNIFTFSSRREVCEIGYQATRRDLWRRRDQLAPLLARHGLRLRVEALEDQERSVWDGVGMPAGRPASAVTERLGDLLTRMESAPPARRRARRRAS